MKFWQRGMRKRRMDMRDELRELTGDEDGPDTPAQNLPPLEY
jgi:hypothetical protein